MSHPFLNNAFEDQQAIFALFDLGNGTINAEGLANSLRYDRLECDLNDNDEYCVLFDELIVLLIWYVATSPFGSRSCMNMIWQDLMLFVFV